MDTSRLVEALQRLPISFGMAMGVRPKCRKIAERLMNKSHCFVLGKGYGEPVAMEGALKLKEMTYIHAEGYSGGALKHGPFALIEGDDVSFVLLCVFFPGVFVLCGFGSCAPGFMIGEMRECPDSEQKVDVSKVNAENGRVDLVL